MTFKELYEQAAALSFDSAYDRFPIDQYKLWVNQGQRYLARYLASSPAPRADELLHALSVVTAHEFTTPLNSWGFPSTVEVLKYFAILIDTSINIKDKYVIIVQDSYFEAAKANKFYAIDALQPICITRKDTVSRRDVIEFFPTIEASGVHFGRLIFRYAKLPDLLSLDTDVPLFDEELQELIIQYAVGRKHFYEGDDQRAQVVIAELKQQLQEIEGLKQR